jgi:16S rRNA (guanine527-N7)-methyltransferase
MDRLVSGARTLGINISRRQLRQFQTYYRELTDWNRRVNLTAITAYEEVQVKHFLDALTVALVWRPAEESATRVIDVGAGGGFPGVPLKIVFPSIRLVLLEATAKKAAFLRHLRDALEIEGMEVVAGRAEELGREPAHRERFDLVLSRAVASLPTLAELTLPFCAIGGSAVLHKKGDFAAEVEGADRAISLLGGRLREVRPVALPHLTDERCLVVIQKVSPTPEKYPRRPGMPVKRPIQ